MAQKKEMSEEEKFEVEEHAIEFYGEDPNIASFDAKIPKFLMATYLILPIWGVFAFYTFWNGSLGWFDRGYWHQLQIAANTTFPIENQNVRILAESEDRPSLRQPQAPADAD